MKPAIDRENTVRTAKPRPVFIAARKFLSNSLDIYILFKSNFMKTIKTTISRDIFHGTDPQTAASLIKHKVDVSRGGGEFGQGFYMGTSKRLAKRRAFHKTEGHLGSAKLAMDSNKSNTFVVSINLTELQKYFFNIKYDKVGSKLLYEKIKKKRAQSTYKLGQDFIMGSVVGTGRYFDVLQFKFESSNSQDMLNRQPSPLKIVLNII